MDINTSKIRELADIALEKQLSELIVQDGDKCITIKLPIGNGAAVVHASGHHPQPVVYTPPAPAPIQEIPATSSAKIQPTKIQTNFLEITAPMVGTFYSAPSPESPAFVKIGDTVAKGQTVCIIEAMKMMNQLESEVSGKVARILVENGEPVEYGQVIIQIEPIA